MEGELDSLITDLLHTISNIQSLREFRLDLSYCNITDAFFPGLSSCLQSLPNLETTRLCLTGCKRLTSELFRGLSKLFTQKNYILQWLQSLIISVSETDIQSEVIQPYLAISKPRRKCFIHAYAKDF